MKTLKKIRISLLFLCLALLLLFNLGLYHAPSYQTQAGKSLNQDFIHHLNFLRADIHQGSAKEMQRIYPEGFVFQNALYGLSWIELLAKLSPEDPLYVQAKEEIIWSLKALSSEDGTRTFQHVRVPRYGTFYLGWINYLKARYLSLLPESERPASLLYELRADLSYIQEIFEGQDAPFLPSYFGACWPADNVVALAAFASYENSYPNSYQTFIENWLKEIKANEDEWDLIPHAWNCGNTNQGESARGSSLSLMLNFLIEIDSTYAKEKFRRYKELFLDYSLGLPGIREYPKGNSGKGDIDSGPVIWGIGGAASIVGRRVMQRYGEANIALGLRNSIETFGLGINSGEEKSYLFGQLPVADAFIAWSNSEDIEQKAAMHESKNWRLQTHLYSLVCFLLLGFLLFRSLKRTKS